MTVTQQDVIKELQKIPRKNDGRIYVTHLKPLVQSIGHDQEMANFLWAQGDAAAKEVAVRVADPHIVTLTTLQQWVRDLNEWGITDAFAGHLVKNSGHGIHLAFEWAKRKPEYEKRAGFATIAQMAWAKNDVQDETFLDFLPVIKANANDDRHHVKKAVNWALRDIGKRNNRLQKQAQNVAIDLQESSKKTEKWVGSHRIKEIFL
jgi:3-methyladenine DNA glycosylase AlkD